MTDRWTPETEALVLDVLEGYAYDGGIPGANFNSNDASRATDAVLDALADASLLITPDGETRTEWAWTYEIVPGTGHPTPWNHCRNRAIAEQELEEHRQRHPQDQMYLGRRDVYECPWDVVDGSDA